MGKNNFMNCKPEVLTIVLENYVKELQRLELNKSINSSKELINRVCYLKNIIVIIENRIVEKYLKQKLSLEKCARKIISTTGLKQEIFKKIFLIKLLDNSEIIDLDLLINTLDLLDIDQLLIIIHAKKGTIYEKIASKKFDELIFKVDNEVLNELTLKIKMDERGR